MVPWDWDGGLGLGIGDCLAAGWYSYNTRTVLKTRLFHLQRNKSTSIGVRVPLFRFFVSCTFILLPHESEYRNCLGTSSINRYVGAQLPVLHLGETSGPTRFTSLYIFLK